MWDVPSKFKLMFLTGWLREIPTINLKFVIYSDTLYTSCGANMILDHSSCISNQLNNWVSSELYKIKLLNK